MPARARRRLRPPWPRDSSRRPGAPDVWPEAPDSSDWSGRRHMFFQTRGPRRERRQFPRTARLEVRIRSRPARSRRPRVQTPRSGLHRSPAAVQLASSPTKGWNIDRADDNESYVGASLRDRRDRVQRQEWLLLLNQIANPNNEPHVRRATEAARASVRDMLTYRPELVPLGPSPIEIRPQLEHASRYGT